MQKPVYKLFPGEYDTLVVNPLDSKMYDVAATTPQVVPGLPLLADFGGLEGSASLHHQGFIGKDGSTYAQGDNSCNISGLGLKGVGIAATKTPIGNAVQITAYANSGNGPSLPAQTGLGYGLSIVTADGKLYLLGNTQSGFRNDGTEGQVAEPSPFLVSLPKPVKKVAIGSFCYALFTDGTVFSWGGSRRQYYPTYVLGRGVDNPDPFHAGAMVFPEPIVDLVGGGEFTYFKGQSGAIYGVAYNTRYLGLGPNVGGQNKPFNLTKILALPDVPYQMATGPQASYALMPNGDAYAWGDNTQAAIGNGQEGATAQKTGIAPWGGGELWQDKPYKINPAGVSFVRIFADIGDAFYVYYEDTNGKLWNNGRNKGSVLWNGKAGSSAQQSATPNAWDVLTVTQISGFGNIPVIPTPPTPPVTPAPRNAVDIKVTAFNTVIDVPLSSCKITYDDGTTQ